MRPPNAARNAAVVIRTHLSKHMSTDQIADLLNDLSKVPGNIQLASMATRIKKEVIKLAAHGNLTQTF
jgi:ribosomal protein L31E